MISPEYFGLEKKNKNKPPNPRILGTTPVPTRPGLFFYDYVRPGNKERLGAKEMKTSEHLGKKSTAVKLLD